MEKHKNKSLDTMRPLFKEWESSGQTKAEFCDQHGIAPSVFYYWYKRYKSENTSGGFIPIKVKNAPAGEHLEIQYPNGVKLKLSADISPALLRQYIYL